MCPNALTVKGNGRQIGHHSIHGNSGLDGDEEREKYSELVTEIERWLRLRKGLEPVEAAAIPGLVERKILLLDKYPMGRTGPEGLSSLERLVRIREDMNAYGYNTMEVSRQVKDGLSSQAHLEDDKHMSAVSSCMILVVFVADHGRIPILVSKYTCKTSSTSQVSN